jgi:hypothetical protein
MRAIRHFLISRTLIRFVSMRSAYFLKAEIDQDGSCQSRNRGDPY